MLSQGSEERVATVQELQEEERRIRYVRFIVDFTSSVIMQGTLSRRETDAMVSAARTKILEVFPGGEHTYELVYSRRFRRLLEEFACPPAPRLRRRSLGFQPRGGDKPPCGR